MKRLGFGARRLDVLIKGIDLPCPLSLKQLEELKNLEDELVACTKPEDISIQKEKLKEFYRVATVAYRAELKQQYTNVMLHPPSANESDEVLEAFLSKNPLITKAELLRLLIRSIGSAKETFSRQKKKRAAAGGAGGKSTRKSKAAAELKAWVDIQTYTIGEGGIRAVARRLANNVPSKDKFHACFDDVQRVIEDHLKSKAKHAEALQK